MESVCTESQVTILDVGKNAVFKSNCTMAKLILLITILLVHEYTAKAVSLIQGQEATLQFPYSCDSTEVTLQQSNRVPFYRSTDGSSLSLTQDQVPTRFTVQNRNNTENCSLEFTISYLLSIDQGTYISFVYKDGEILFEQTHRIRLHVDYPPGEASCLVSEDKGGEWVSIDCIAKVGSLSGKIECYQGGVWMPSLTDPTHTYTLLKQTILIRKSQPVFCCSSTLTEYTDRCECDDTALYLDDTSSSDPCPTTSIKTSTASIDRTPDLVEKSHSSNSSLPSETTSTNAKKMTKINLNAIIISYILVTGVVILLILNAIFLYQSRQECKNNSNDKSQKLKYLIIYYYLATHVVILLILNAISHNQSRQERKNNSNDETRDSLSIFIYYFLATGVVILLILNAISIYRSRQERKINSNGESQDPSLSRKVHGDDVQECETEKLNQAVGRNIPL